MAFLGSTDECRCVEEDPDVNGGLVGDPHDIVEA